MTAGPIREAVYLISHGFSEDLAFSLPDRFRLAFAIIVAEQNGFEWDWQAMRFKEPQS